MVKTHLAGIALIAAACAVAGEHVDPRVRTFIDPCRIVWTTATETAEGAACKVEGGNMLLASKHGQTPENGWGRRGGEYGCFLVNGGKVPGVLLDFGRELHGGLQVICGRGQKGQRIRVRFGESASEAMCSIGDGRHATKDHAIRDCVVEVPWLGSREIGNTGFRFVRIDLVTEGRLQLECVRAISLMRPMERKGAFRCSDERINRIYETAVRTVHLCCQDYLWDGIKRDRLVWMGDTQPETMAIISAFGAAEIIPESLDFAADTTLPDTWMNSMPCYTLWWIRNLAEWYRYTGDKAYLAKHAEYLSRTVAHAMSVISPSNTWDATGFLDWPTKHNQAATDSGKQALAKIAFEEGAFLADALGDTDLASSCRKAAATLATLRLEAHGAKTAAAMLALSGHRDPADMFASVLGRSGHSGVSTFYGYYMLEAMSAAGEHVRALNTVRDYWGAMLDMGATSFWEDFNIAWTNGCARIDELPSSGQKDIHGDFGEFCYPGFRHSLCHGWSAGPAAWLVSHVLGIQPVGVGCRTVRVVPRLDGLDWAEGAFPTPLGVVRVKATRLSGGKIDVSISAPPGVTVLRP